MKNFHKRGGLLVFILLFRNLKAQNGIIWARIGCFDVYDNSVVEVQFLINTLGNWLELPPHPPAAVCEIMVLYYRLNASSVELILVLTSSTF